MNSKNCFRRTKGDYLRAAAGAAVLIAAAISTAALWAIALSDSGEPSASSPQQATAAASVSLASLVLTVGGALVAVMVVVVAVGYGRRRIARRRAGVRRGGMHAKAPGPRAGGAINTATDPYPSWPGPPGPYALHPDHPSWPGRPDPRWPSTETILREDDHQHSHERQAPALARRRATGPRER
jgi:hypothetical protein